MRRTTRVTAGRVEGPAGETTARGRATRPAPLSYPGWAIRLGEAFDAVLPHDAISYMTTEADLLAVFATARAHLRPGGLLIAAPDDYTDTFDPSRVDYQTNRDANTELTYVEYSTDLDPTDTTIETTYVFFIKKGGELRVEVDNHTTGLFPIPHGSAC